MSSAKSDVTTAPERRPETTPIPRWTDATPDPNSPAAHAYRGKVVAAAARPPVSDRVAFLAGEARGKRVLDLGVVNHTTESTVTASWLYDHVRMAALLREVAA